MGVGDGGGGGGEDTDTGGDGSDTGVCNQPHLSIARSFERHTPTQDGQMAPLCMMKTGKGVRTGGLGTTTGGGGDGGGGLCIITAYLGAICCQFGV